MVKDSLTSNVSFSSREKEKEKFINLISKPKDTNSQPGIKFVSKIEPVSKLTNFNFAFDAREKEKDRLAAIFASTSSGQFLKASGCDISKNLNGKKSEHLCSEGNHQFDLNKNTEIKYKDDHKAFVPHILVSEYQEDKGQIKFKTNTVTTGPTMVRTGEFSPHNPNNPVGKPTLGIGEYDERRKLILDQQKEDYNKYLQKVKTTQPELDISNNFEAACSLKDAATQTEWTSGDVGSLEYETSPIHDLNKYSPKVEQKCHSPSHILSPIPKCFEGLTEKEIKEYLYREELRKQIEEKNRLKEERKRKEQEEEAKIEAKIRREQEEMRRRFEAERLERIELAIRKKEQEDILRERLASEQLKVLEESRVKRRLHMKDGSVSSNDTLSPRCIKNKKSKHGFTTLTQALPDSCPSKVVQDIHDALRQPLMKPQAEEIPLSQRVEHNVLETGTSCRNVSALNERRNNRQSQLVPNSPPLLSVKKVDVAAQKSVFSPTNVQSFVQQIPKEKQNLSSQNIKDKMEEIDVMLKKPLLSQNHDILPPVSPPLLHATIPPLTASLQPSYSSFASTSTNVQRTNSEILEDKWKVPYVEQYNVATPDIQTKHNRSVLTQLGAFRKHLQQERLRMQQRVLDDSP